MGGQGSGFLEDPVRDRAVLGLDDHMGAGGLLGVEPPVPAGGKLEGQLVVLVVVAAHIDVIAVRGDIMEGPGLRGHLVGLAALAPVVVLLDIAGFGQSEEVKDRIRIMGNCDGSGVSLDFIRFALGSIAKYAIFPLQDLLQMDSDARMNTPGVAAANWAFRYEQSDLDVEWRREWLLRYTKVYGRI